ncbi:MAG TPA: winged helix-turn-helix domain-containing protein [Edaphobacter sp.]|nr:winged helix-turn-helix domain-containing protein [Edaphobacter sp.]
MNHPLRLQILGILSERVASPNQLTRITKQDLSTVSYHVRVLVDEDCLILVRTEPRRGAVEHFYRANLEAFMGSRDWPRVPPPLREEISGEAWQELSARVIAALEAKTFQRRDGSGLSWLPLRLDEAGWEEAREIVTKAERSIRETGEASARRLKDQPGIPVIVALAAFEAVTGEEPA